MGGAKVRYLNLRKLLPAVEDATWLPRAVDLSTLRIRRARRLLGLKSLLAKSIETSNGRLQTILSGELGEHVVESTTRKNVPRGTGDLLSGLFLGQLLRGKAGPSALEESLALLDRIIERSAGAPALDLTPLRMMGTQ